MTNRFDQRPERGVCQALQVALALLWRAIAVGFVFYILPPTGELPYRWQAAVAFPILTSWCYGYGVFARRDVQVAALEAIPTLWLSLKCTDLLIRLASFWS